MKMRRNVTIDDHIKGEFAVKAWLEADALEATLNRHNCGIERAFIYLAREYIFKYVFVIFYYLLVYLLLIKYPDVHFS